MLALPKRLSSKIIAILIVFFIVAITAISLTLLMSWQLEGGGAAINDAGSLRMRSYRQAYLLALYADRSDEALEAEIGQGIAAFEQVLSDLERGDPARPLFLPRQREIREVMADLRSRWSRLVRPMAERIVDAPPSRRERLMGEFRPMVDTFVADINTLVLLVERSNARSTELLRTLQLALVALALVGTVFLIYVFTLMVIRPVQGLQDGIKRMAGGDFAVRLAVESRDEFGDLAMGFNAMADHLQEVYRTLEDRVHAKTRSLEEKNRELATLYEIAAFLSEPGTAEDLSAGVLRRAMETLDAQAGAVRLTDADSRRMHLIVHDGLPPELAHDDAVLCVGECLCGMAAGSRQAVLDAPPANGRLHNCRQAGYQAVAVFPIAYKKQLLGVLSLHFREPPAFTPQAMHLVETLARHLGVALENQRLVSREKEMAVSEERNLLAQELHDSIAQSLAFLNIQVQLLQDSLQHGKVEEALAGLAEIREGVQESYDDVRELLVHFRTRVHQADLGAAIRSALEKFEGQTGIHTRFQQRGSGLPLPPEYEVQLLHIVQEALSNVRKHARASAVTVTAEHSPSGFAVTVADDGIGFDAGDNAREAADTHVGIKIMRERAHRIGGRLMVGSSAGAGTTVRLDLPLKDKVEAA